MITKPSPRLADSVRRALVAVGLGATLVLGSAGAASAGTWTHDDPSKDVISADGEFESFEPAPERAAGDIQRIAVSHMQSKVVMRLNLRKGLRSDGWAILEHIRTPGATFELSIYRFDGDAGIEIYKDAASGGEVSCRGLEISYATRSVLITVPTRCLGNPRTVKVGAWTYTIESEDLFYLDDAFRRGIGDNGPRLSPLIPRG